jgi:hypothetical protein
MVDLIGRKDIQCSAAVIRDAGIAAYCRDGFIARRVAKLTGLIGTLPAAHGRLRDKAGE